MILCKVNEYYDTDINWFFRLWKIGQYLIGVQNITQIWKTKGLPSSSVLRDILGPSIVLLRSRLQWAITVTLPFVVLSSPAEISVVVVVIVIVSAWVVIIASIYVVIVASAGSVVVVVRLFILIVLIIVTVVAIVVVSVVGLVASTGLLVILILSRGFLLTCFNWFFFFHRLFCLLWLLGFRRNRVLFGRFLLLSLGQNRSFLCLFSDFLGRSLVLLLSFIFLIAAWSPRFIIPAFLGLWSLLLIISFFIFMFGCGFLFFFLSILGLRLFLFHFFLLFFRLLFLDLWFGFFNLLSFDFTFSRKTDVVSTSIV